MSEVGLIIFDCDGVLVDSEPISNGVLAQMLTEQGLPTTLPQARREYQGLLLGDVLTLAEQKLGHPLPAGWLTRYERTRAAVFRRELRAVPGAADILRLVGRSRDVRACVASQGKLEKTRLTLGITNLAELIDEDAIFSAESVARGKPHPDLFQHAAKAMGFGPEECVVVEDTVIGVTAAVAAGMRVFGYCADSEELALRQAGAQTIHSLAELACMIADDG